MQPKPVPSVCCCNYRMWSGSLRLPGEHLEQLSLLRDLSAADFKYLGDEQKMGK